MESISHRQQIFPIASQRSPPVIRDFALPGMSVTNSAHSTCTDLRPWLQAIPGASNVTATASHEAQNNSTLSNTQQQVPRITPGPDSVVYPRPRPKRQVATTTSYNLRQAWGTFDHFLSESSTSSSDSETSDPGVEASKTKQSPYHGHTKRNKGEVLSDDGSASDAYEEAETGYRRRVKRAKNTKLRGSGAKKRAALMKLEKADMDVIHEANGTFNSGRKRKNRKDRLSDLTRAEAKRLTMFILETIDWEGAAKCLRASTVSISADSSLKNCEQAGSDHPTCPAVTWSIPGKTGSVKTAEMLSRHWKEVLGRRFTDMYEG